MKEILQIRFIQALVNKVLFFILISSAAHAQEKVMEAFTPMGTLGESTEMGKQIICNSLQESLSTHYALASHKDFETALTQVFERLDYDECTEDQCFALIQQIIQADNLFFLNMTTEGSFTQHSLTRIDLDSQRLVRTAFCQDCSIGELNIMVEELWMKLIAEDQISTVETKTILKPKPAPKPVPEPETEPELEVQAEESPTSDKTWHYVAISVTVVSALMSYNAANTYNELSEKNITLATQYANSNSSTEKTSYKSEYDSNASKMKSNKSSIQTWDLMTLAGLGWEAYLLMTDDFANTAPNSGKSFSLYIPRIALHTAPSGPQTFLRWNWRF